MKSQLCVLEGLAVREAKEVEDYVQLFFDNGAILNINGNFTISAGNTLADLRGIMLLRAHEVFQSPEYADFHFDNGLHLHVDLSNPDPEAMELMVPGQPIVVWN